MHIKHPGHVRGHFRLTHSSLLTCNTPRINKEERLFLIYITNKKWTLTVSATPPKARRVSCRVRAMFMVLSLTAVGVGPASWFKALSRGCHSTWRFRANLRAFLPVLALHSGLNAPTEGDMLVFPLQYLMYSSRADAVNVYSRRFSWLCSG